MLPVLEDPHYKSYVIKQRQLFIYTIKTKGATFGKKLISSLKHEAAGRIKIFSDEKSPPRTAKTNRTEGRRRCGRSPNCSEDQFPGSVMVLGVVCSNGDIMPPHFFGDKETVNAEVYIRVLDEVVKPWTDRVTRGAPYAFQQNSAPAHAAKKTYEWCRANMSMVWTKNFWPSNSPDFNPLHYHVWGGVQKLTNQRAHNTKDS